MRLIDLTGQKIAHWLVLKRAKNYRRTFAQWKCRCDCGVVRIVLAGSLLQGKSTNCGCIAKAALIKRHTKHGQSLRKKSTSTYQVWKHIRQRCTNPRSKDYKYYGGRGISICERWSSFENFFADMGSMPTGLTIDRIDNDGNYEPENCRWTTMAVQNFNKRGIYRGKPPQAGLAESVAALND